LRKAIAALAIIFLAAHLPFLPPTLEDLDSINFALGVRHFDVAKHQPHPPGYPVFIAMAKASTAALRATGIASPESRGLAIWSAICGAAVIFPLVALFLALDGSERRAWWATLAVALSPLFWFSGLRPLSDSAGLAAAVLAQALTASAIAGLARPRAIVQAAFIAGLAIGIRSQTFLLTLPLLALALAWRPLAWTLRDRLAAVAAFAIGVVVWAVPLIVASGGLSSYAAALGSQAGEDLSGVVMLWNMRHSGVGPVARAGVDALVHSFLWPWGNPIVGSLVLAAAVIGCGRVAFKAPRALALIAVAFLPYAIFHLLFHEVVTTRYALPLVLPVAFFLVQALDLTGRRVSAVGALALGIWSLWITIPATLLFGASGSPAFRAFQDVMQSAGGGTRPRIVAMHAVMRRAADWIGDDPRVRMVKALHGHEWLALVDAWRADPAALVSYVADPRRTDLALIDPVSRRGPQPYRWPFIEPPFVGGARPGNADVYAMRPPGWMLDRGWAITAEVAGITAKDGDGPHVKPSVAWIRTRPGAATLTIGGRHLVDGAPPVRIALSLDGVALESFETAPGYFFRRLDLPAGSLERGSDRGQTGVRPGSDQGQTRVRPPASEYVPLSVISTAADGSTRQIAVGLEQFDLQSPGVPMAGAESGWYEPEYNPRTAQAWRWTSEKAVLWVRPVGRDVTLTLSGESPLRYFDRAPTVIVAAGPREVARFTPSTDFTQSVVLAADALAAADGRITISSDKVFVPADRGGPPDRRHLALRIYSYSVK
jgi:hypothetical protein